MKNSNFTELFNFLKTCSLTINDGELVVELNDTDESAEAFKLALQEAGYSVDSIRTIRESKGYISLNARNWENDCPLYSDWEILFSFVESTSVLPESFFVINEKLSSLDETEEKLSLKLFCQGRYLLAALADQCEPPNKGPSKGARKLFFIIETEGGVAKYSFKPTITWNALQKIPVDEQQIELTQKLQQLISLGDSQDTERRSVMRSAFHEIISVYHSDSAIFEGILSSIEKLYKRYEEHHDLFVQRFSINKVLQEISEKDLAYTSKVNEILSSAQSKALTIPGALILIGAVMKIDQLADALVVALAILLTTILVHKGLNVHSDTFRHISDQVSKEFKQYDVLSEKVEVRKKAKDAEEELSNLLEKADDNSEFMKCAIWFLCIAAMAFIAFTVVDFDSGDSKAGHTNNSSEKCEVIDKQNNASEAPSSSEEKVN